jgi:hypothetical protein
MNFKTMFQISLGMLVFAVDVHAGKYLDYQIQFLEEASIVETNENDQKAGNYFASLATKSGKENRQIEVADLPPHWQSAPERKPEYRDRLLELESVIESIGTSQRENYAEPIARLQVCLFHARHEMSETLFSRDTDIKKYMNCADIAYNKYKELSAISHPVAVNNDLPLAKPGECYARIYTPSKYEVEEYQVIKVPASSRIEISPAAYETIEMSRMVKEASKQIMEIPAVYNTVEESILVKEASTKITESPALYKTIEERIVVKEPSTRLETIPAVYEWIDERVIDVPAHTAWKEGGKIVEKIDGTTNQPVCLVEVPATYKTIKKRVLKSAVTSREYQVPAEYKIVTKQVIDQPATTKVTEIPAEYKVLNKRVVKTPATTKVMHIPAVYTVERVQRLVSPAVVKEISIPPVYEVVTRTNFLAPSRLEWRQVLCDVNLTSDRIIKIQKALEALGYYLGTSWGNLDDETLNSITKFQQDNKLGTGGITLETVRLLESNI